MNKNKLSIEKHIEVSELIRNVDNGIFIDVYNSCNKSSKISKSILKINKELNNFKSEMEEKFLKEYPHITKSMDVILWHNSCLSLYYGTEEEFKKVINYLKEVKS